MKLFKTTSLLLASSLSLLGQEAFDVDQSEFTNWHNESTSEIGFIGSNVERSYTELLKGKKSKKTVVVAIMDSGVDINHPEFKGKIWVNEDEIPGNGIDDDKNGYIDDVHGWSFLGNPEGENLDFENYEMARIVGMGDDGSKVYKRAYEALMEIREEDQAYADNLSRIRTNFIAASELIKEETEIEVVELDDLKKVKADTEDLSKAVNYLGGLLKQGATLEVIDQEIARIDKKLNITFNPDYNGRQKVIGDNPFDLEDRDYGNNDVTGPDASHGTAVAGVIAAVRDEHKVEGIAQNVQIMSIRSTPSGDERDKDVALGIRYAVDNGADIINMSFGKNFSPQKEWVDEAVRYAESKGVLIVHAAGNSSLNTDREENYPSGESLDGYAFKNWLEVGASGPNANEHLAAFFSNYGRKSVDIFAPGVSIVSLDLDSAYSSHNGTSLAAPVVSGIAALVWSYYPELTAEDMAFVIRESAYPMKKLKVIKPNEDGKEKKTRFKKLSITGGLVDAYRALELADEISKTKEGS